MRKSIYISKSRELGVVLVTSLVFLLVLTLVAVIAMQTTVTDQKISTNLAFKTKSFENSESPRPKAGDVVDHHVFERGWDNILNDAGNYVASDGSVIYEGLTIDETNAELMYFKNGKDAEGGDEEVVEDALDPSSLLKDMTYERSVSGADGSEAIVAELSVFRNGAHALPGHSAAMVSGYEGTGKAMAGSGSAIFYDVRSQGYSALANVDDNDTPNDPGDDTTTYEKIAGAQSVTSADVRVVVRN